MQPNCTEEEKLSSKACADLYLQLVCQPQGIVWGGDHQKTWLSLPTCFSWVGFISSGTLGMLSGKQRQLHFTCQGRSHKEQWIAVKHAKARGTKSLITFISAQSSAQLYHLDKNCENSAVQTTFFLMSLWSQIISTKVNSPYRKQQTSERALETAKGTSFSCLWISPFYKDIIWTDWYIQLFISTWDLTNQI